MTNKHLNIVGAGAVGLYLAWHFQKNGCAVSLYEINNCGGGSSASALGVAWSPALRRKTNFHELHRQSLAKLNATLDELELISGCKNLYKESQGVDVISSLGQLKDRENELKLAEENSAKLIPGKTYHYLNSAELNNLMPHLNFQDYGACILNPVTIINTSQLLDALKIACQTTGVKIHENEKVISVIEKDQQIEICSLTSKISTGNPVILTAGLNSYNLVPQYEKFCTTSPVYGQAIEVYWENHGIKDLIRYKKIHFIPSSANSMIIGATSSPKLGHFNTTQEETTDYLISLANDLFKNSDISKVIRAWSGLRPAMPDRLPCIGKFPSSKLLYVATGHYKIGLAFLPATAEIIEYEIANGAQHKLANEIAPRLTGKPTLVGIH